MLCARTRVGMASLGSRRHLLLEGPHVVEFLGRLLTRDVSKLDVGAALKVAWLSDGGAVRGAAAIARSGEEQFWLLSASRDCRWIQATAALFGVRVHDVSADRTGLGVLGPFARATLDAAGLETTDLKPLAFRSVMWGLDVVVLSRFGEHGGYEIWCARDEEAAVRERLARAGAPFGIAVLGPAAMDGLDIEAGVPRPGRDYTPAHESNMAAPSPLALGLASLIDVDHEGFSGREAYLEATAKETRRLAGVEFDFDVPAPHAPLYAGAGVVGRTLGSVYSPALRRAIALAQIEGKASRPGTSLTLSPSADGTGPEPGAVGATVVELPFLPPCGGANE